MNIKRIGISIIIGVILAFAFIMTGETDFSEYTLSYTVNYENAGNTQLFYTKGEEDFVEDKMVILDVPRKKEVSVESSITKENNRVRIDLGYTDNTVILKNLKISGMGMKISLADTQIIEKNQIQDISYEGGEYEITVKGDDSYIVFDVFSEILQLEEKSQSYNHILNYVYAIVGVLIVLLVYWKYNKIKGLILWLLDIIKEWRLIWKLALNDFKLRYITSYLGTIWAFVQPIVTIIIYVLVFGMGFKSLPVEGIPFAVWLTTGIVPWFFFQEAWMSATNSLLEYSYLVKKVVFKINLLPMVKVTASIFVHFFFIAAAMVLQLIYGMPIDFHILQIVYYLLCVIVLTLGMSYITSALVVFLKDIGQIVNIFLQFGMWLTPIMYRVDMFGKTGERLLKLNPMFYIVDGYRDAFFQGGWFWQKPGLTLYFWCVTGIVMAIGAKIFKSLEKHFADVL